MSAAAIIASQNAQREYEAKKRECSLYVEGFTHDNATTEQMYVYTECVETLYPKPVQDLEPTAFGKVSVIAMLIAFVVGMVQGYKEDGVFGGILFATIFPLALIFIAIVVGLVGIGIGYVLS